MKTAKQLLALVLALVLCLSVFAGCQQNPAETTKSTDGSKSTEGTTAATTDTTAPAMPQTNLEIYPLETNKTYKIALATTEDADAS